MIFDGLRLKRPKKTLAETEWAKEAQRKQASLVLDALREIGPDTYAEKILKHMNSNGHDFGLWHIKASLKWLTNHSLVKKETRDRVAYYTTK